MFSSTICLLAALGASAMGVSDYDEYGGWTLIKGEKTGYFHAQRIDGVWWLIDPLGNAFISKGVNHISFTADHAPALGYSPYGRVTAEKYGDASTWAKQAIENLRGWGFNTIGAWSHNETFRQKMPYTLILGLGATTGGDWQKGKFPDVFSEGFRDAVEREAQRQCSPNMDDPYLLGYFMDNELRWGPDWRSPAPLFDDFLAMPGDCAGKIALVNTLKKFYGDIDGLNAAWNTNCDNFDDILDAQKLSDLGVEISTVEPIPALPYTLPKGLAKMYLQQFYGAIGKVNEAFGTDAKSFDKLLTPEFLPRLAVDIRDKVPREVAIIGLNMCYVGINSANRAFNTDAKSFDELVDMFFGAKSPSSTVMEIEKAQKEFLETVARQYFKVCGEAIRKADPNHLILGCRFAGYAPVEVVRGMKGHVDVVSYNNYNKLPPARQLAEIYGIVERPIMLTEFSFKAMDSGLPNTRGAGVPVETQKDRAYHFEQYVTELMALPYAVGFHWFEYADEPAEGRFDGEDSNYGLVNIKDEPWEILVRKMSEVNRKMEAVHKEDQ